MLTVLLRCRDLDETREFYRSALGFDTRDTPEATLTVEQGDAALVFTPNDLWNGLLGFSGTIYFTVPDVCSYYASVKDRVKLAWPLQDTSYGSKEFGVTDCNGYHLAFQQKA